VLGDGKNAANWSPSDKFTVVLATTALNKADLAEYYPRKDLHAEQITL